MRKSVIAALILLAVSLQAGDRGEVRVMSFDNVTWTNGISSPRLKALKRTYDSPFLYFEKDGKAYVVTESATIDRMRAVLEPQMELGRRQGELGAKQGELGAAQGSLGEAQARLGAEQAMIALRQAREPQDSSQAARMEALARRQQELAAQQGELGRQQGMMGRRQGELGQQQEALSKAAAKKIESLIDEALRSGVARAVTRMTSKP